MAGKIQIDPAHPLGSMTAGNQQFTIAADTNHSRSSIFGTVAADIPLMARNGTRHIMLEFAQEPMSALTERYPGLAAATTWDARRQTLNDVELGITQRRQQLLQDALKDLGTAPDAPQQAARRADAVVALEMEHLKRARLDIDSHELIEGTFSKPPKFTDDQIRTMSTRYVNATSDNPTAAANNFANILITSRNNGIRVHFTGDRYPADMVVAFNEADMDITTFNAANERLALHDLKLTTQRGYQIPPEDLDGYRAWRAEGVRLSEVLSDRMGEMLALRDDPALEQRRVDRMIALANGERATVVWGAAHAFKDNDFNEMFDARLRAQATIAGRPAPAATMVLELADSRLDHEVRPLQGRTQDPHVRYFISDRTLDILPAGAALLEAKPAPLSSGQSLGLSEYAALMERLTGSATPSVPPPPERKVAAVTPKPEFTP